MGRLAPGWQADLQLIDSTLPTPVESWNLYDQLLLYRSRRDVTAVMVAGQWRVRDGVVLGVDEPRCAPVSMRPPEDCGSRHFEW